MNHRPSFCIANTVLNQRFRQVRPRISPRLPKTKRTFQEKAPVNSFRFDVSTHSTATLYSSNQKPTARHLVRVFDVSTHLTETQYGKLYCQTPKRCFVWFFSRKKLVFGGKTNSFLGKIWFSLDKPAFASFCPGKTQKTQQNIFLKTVPPDSKKMFFLVFPRTQARFFQGKVSVSLLFSLHELLVCTCVGVRMLSMAFGAITVAATTCSLVQ